MRLKKFQEKTPKMAKNKSKKNLKDPKVIVIAQEIKLAKMLAGNDRKIRDQALKNLHKWLLHRSQSSIPFREDDFLRIWKGLFYCMWMSDKMLVQEKCAESIAGLIHSITKPKSALLFFKCFAKVMMKDLIGVDQWRLDKFLMMTRRVLRQYLITLKKNEWDIHNITLFGEVLNDTILGDNDDCNEGFVTHFIQTFFEEIAKVVDNNYSKSATKEFLRPFVKFMIPKTNITLMKLVCRNTFQFLMTQSDLGIEFTEKYKYWRQIGFAGGNINMLQKNAGNDSDDSEEEQQKPVKKRKKNDADSDYVNWEVEDSDSNKNSNDKAFDPRAGHVDVELSQIPFDCKQIISLLEEYKFNSASTKKFREIVTKLIKQFQLLDKGIYPLGSKRVPLPTQADLDGQNVFKATKRLMAFEENLMTDKKLTKAQKKKLKRAQKMQNMEGALNGTDDNEENQPEDEIDNQIDSGNIKPPNQMKKKTKNKLPEKKKGMKRKLENADKEDIVSVGHNPLSGVWEVSENQSTKKNKTNDIIKSKTNPTVRLEHKLKKNIEKHNKKLELVPHKNRVEKRTRQKILTKPKPTNESPQSEPIFSVSNSWNDELQDGESEIFVPSKKYKKKLRGLAKEQGTTVSNLLNTVNEKILTTRKTPEKTVLPNIFATPKKDSSPKTPMSSTKKVKIVLHKNMAQETSEYRKQLKNSPAIPFDANKKPLKPLLKRTSMSSPINPFYNLKASFHA